MKKLLRKNLVGLLTAALLLPLVLGMTSCAESFRLNRMEESKRALEFMKLLDKKMDSQSGYTTDMESSMVFEVYGVEVTAKVRGTMIVCGDGAENYFTYAETRNVMTMDGESVENSIIEG